MLTVGPLSPLPLVMASLAACQPFSCDGPSRSGSTRIRVIPAGGVRLAAGSRLSGVFPWAFTNS